VDEIGHLKDRVGRRGECHLDVGLREVTFVLRNPDGPISRARKRNHRYGLEVLRGCTRARANTATRRQRCNCEGHTNSTQHWHLPPKIKGTWPRLERSETQEPRDWRDLPGFRFA